ncbi:hypothetical protein [Natronorubrum tibetense]|uniref:hypothetical protein n=1 Tax=Natronorubrum tibetense TaxID=63128 RepID=UPI0012B5DE1B|nr:hypothetical protein [Natronorubrum tibetense]
MSVPRESHAMAADRSRDGSPSAGARRERRQSSIDINSTRRLHPKRRRPEASDR